MQFGYTIETIKKKHPELTDELLETLQSWAREHGIREIPVEQLAMFAHSCYFHVDDTIRCMNTYYRMRATNPEFFCNRDPELDQIQHTLNTLHTFGLPVTDPDGNRIICHRLRDTRPDQFILDDAIKLFLMTFEVVFHTEEEYPKGTVILFDMQGVKLKHLMKVSVSSLRTFLEYVQNGLPTRLKGIHILNAVWFFDKILAIIRPFMKKELYGMLHPYPGDVSDVYSTIPPKCLPMDYGGQLDTIENLHEQFRQRLHDLRDHFLEEETVFRSCPITNGNTTASNIRPVKGS